MKLFTFTQTKSKLKVKKRPYQTPFLCSADTQFNRLISAPSIVASYTEGWSCHMEVNRNGIKR
jgi:hypothetical protein